MVPGPFLVSLATVCAKFDWVLSVMSLVEVVTVMSLGMVILPLPLGSGKKRSFEPTKVKLPFQVIPYL